MNIVRLVRASRHTDSEDILFRPPESPRQPEICVPEHRSKTVNTGCKENSCKFNILLCIRECTI